MCAALKIGRRTSGTYFSWCLSCGSLERALAARSDGTFPGVCVRAHPCVCSLLERWPQSTVRPRCPWVLCLGITVLPAQACGPRSKPAVPQSFVDVCGAAPEFIPGGGGARRSSSFSRPVRSTTVEGDMRGCVGSGGRARGPPWMPVGMASDPSLTKFILIK